MKEKEAKMRREGGTERRKCVARRREIYKGRAT